MKYYLKKCWPTVTAASICMVVAYGLQVCTSLVQIQITQGLLDGDLRAFTIRIILLLLTWLATRARSFMTRETCGITRPSSSSRK